MIESPIFRFGGIALGLKKLPKGAFELIRMLSIQITELEIQRERIRNNSLLVFSNSRLGHEEGEEVYYTLLSDIHFYIIAWTNVQKTLRRLYALTHDPKIEWVVRRRRKWFEQVRRVRNSLEHMDDRITASSSNTYNLLRLAGYAKPSIVVCGVRLDVSETSLRRIDALVTDIDKWVSRLPERSWSSVARHPSRQAAYR